MNQNEMQEFTSKRNTSNRKLYPDTRHTATLRRFYNNPHRRLPQAFTQTHKRKQEKEVATSLLRIDPQLDCLAPRASRASRLSSTCASRQRAPLGHVRLSTTLPGPPQYSALVRASQAHALKSASSHNSKPLVSAASQAASRTPTLVLSTSAFQHTLSALRPFSSHVRFPTCAAFQAASLSDSTQNSTSAFSTRPLGTVPRSLLGAFFIHLRQSGEDTLPLPLPFLASETGR